MGRQPKEQQKRDLRLQVLIAVNEGKRSTALSLFDPSPASAPALSQIDVCAREKILRLLVRLKRLVLNGLMLVVLRYREAVDIYR